MITFDEFFRDYIKEIVEIFRDADLEEKERRAIIYAMEKRFGNRRMGGMEFLSIFEELCTSFTPKESKEGYAYLEGRLDYAEETYIDHRADIMLEYDPTTSFETLEEKGLLVR